METIQCLEICSVINEFKILLYYRLIENYLSDTHFNSFLYCYMNTNSFYDNSKYFTCLHDNKYFVVKTQ